MRNDVGICICGHNMPRFLFVTLDSLYRVRGIEKYNVHAYIDGGDESLNQQFEWVFSKFPVCTTVIRDSNIGNIAHTLDSLEACFNECNYNEIIFLEHDLAFRPDFLEYSESIGNTDDFSVNLGRINSNEHTPGFCILGARITKEKFFPMAEWIRGEKYIGMLDPTRNIVFDDDAIDGLIHAYALAHNMTTHFSTKEDHMASFGIKGMHAVPDDEHAKYQNLLFQGPMGLWLWNIALLLYEGRYGESVEYQLFPKGSRMLIDVFNQTNSGWNEMNYFTRWPW